jgi:hypothetical protein
MAGIRSALQQWDDADSHVEELIGLIGDYRVARAAFEEAVSDGRGGFDLKAKDAFAG